MKLSSEVSVGPALDDLLARFPGWRREIEAEYRLNDSFRSLCDDWRVCAEARERWCASEAPVAVQRRHEYKVWLWELEQEIEDWLKHGMHA